MLVWWRGCWGSADRLVSVRSCYGWSYDSHAGTSRSNAGARAGWRLSDIFNRNENKRERTLNACNRYESDVVVEGCVRRLRTAMDSDELKGKERSFRQDAIVLLNYLDTLAIGVQQGLYDENLAFDHTNAIVQKWYDLLLNYETAKTFGIDLKDYNRLCGMAQRWANVEPRFGRRWWKRRHWT